MLAVSYVGIVVIVIGIDVGWIVYHQEVHIIKPSRNALARTSVLNHNSNGQALLLSMQFKNIKETGTLLS